MLVFAQRFFDTFIGCIQGLSCLTGVRDALCREYGWIFAGVFPSVLFNVKFADKFRNICPGRRASFRELSEKNSVLIFLRSCARICFGWRIDPKGNSFH